MRKNRKKKATHLTSLVEDDDGIRDRKTKALEGQKRRDGEKYSVNEIDGITK